MLCWALASGPKSQAQTNETDAWALARQHCGAHRFSTLFTAQDVRRYLASDERLKAAIDWCKQTGITKVYVESFRDNYQVERPVSEHAKKEFAAAGFEVSGCVTTTGVGKPSTGWKDVASCYTDPHTQDRLKEIFEYAAGSFDEIMIDDFWFTDCACPECDAARLAKKVRVGGKEFPVAGDSWADYRCELMVQLSRAQVLAAAKRVNPKARLIIKLPQCTTISTTAAMTWRARRWISTGFGWGPRRATSPKRAGARRRSTKAISSCAGWGASAAPNAAAGGMIRWGQPEHLPRASAANDSGRGARVYALCLRLAPSRPRVRGRAGPARKAA